MADRAELDELLRQAKVRWDAMSPEERENMLRQQRRSYVISEMGMGDDEDELAYRAAHNRGDTAEMKRLQAEAEQRAQAAAAVYDRMFPNG